MGEGRESKQGVLGKRRFHAYCRKHARGGDALVHLKIHHGFERMRLRGLSGARDEFHLAAIVQNLKTLALRILGPPTALWPAALVE
jgi:hypothetical protein